MLFVLFVKQKYNLFNFTLENHSKSMMNGLLEIFDLISYTRPKMLKYYYNSLLSISIVVRQNILFKLTHFHVQAY